PASQGGDGTACDDQHAGTGADTCQGGVCSGTPVVDGTACDDGSDCTTADSCEAGQCRGTPAASGLACASDGNVCSGDECDGSGRCIQPIDPARLGTAGTTAAHLCAYGAV